MTLETPTTYSGYVAIVGRPNVGKSSLLNKLLGQKISITSKKPQTTRHRILGIKTIDNAQIIFLDTPGLHRVEHRALNRYMNKAARSALKDVEIVIFMIEALKWTEEDEAVLTLLKKLHKPVILLVNKVDIIKQKENLLPFLKTLQEKFAFTELIPISVTRGQNLETLEKKILTLLPEGPHYFPETSVTDRSDRFRIAETIREKLLRFLGEELPYSSTVEIESLKKETAFYVIHAIIWVEREGQKPIVIGKNGERLKEIGTTARIDMEKMLGSKVHLRLWVKVRSGWTNDERALVSLGYMDFE